MGHADGVRVRPESSDFLPGWGRAPLWGRASGWGSWLGVGSSLVGRGWRGEYLYRGRVPRLVLFSSLNGTGLLPGGGVPGLGLLEGRRVPCGRALGFYTGAGILDGGRGSVGGASAWGGVISGGGAPRGLPPPHQHTCEISCHLACAERRPRPAGLSPPSPSSGPCDPASKSGAPGQLRGLEAFWHPSVSRASARAATRSPEQEPDQTAVTPPSPRNLDGVEPVLPGESTWGPVAEGPGPRGLALAC